MFGSLRVAPNGAVPPILELRLVDTMAVDLGMRGPGVSLPGPSVTDGMRPYITKATRRAHRQGRAVVDTAVLARALHLPMIGLKDDLGLAGILATSWRDTGDDDGGPADSSSLWAVGALQRETAWHVAMDQANRSRGSPKEPLPFSRGLNRVIERALTEAHAVGVTWPTYRHLVLGLLLDPSALGCQVLVKSGLDREAWIAALRSHASIRQDAEPSTALSFRLQNGRALIEWCIRVSAARRGQRFDGLLVSFVATNGMGLAARLGHPRASSAHLLCALWESADEIQRTEGSDIRPDIMQANTASDLLRKNGLTPASLILAAASLPNEPAIVTRPRGYHVGSFITPYWSESAETACRTAAQLARSLGHRHVGTNHLLVACLDDPNGPASHTLRSLDVDPGLALSAARLRLGS